MVFLFAFLENGVSYETEILRVEMWEVNFMNNASIFEMDKSKYEHILRAFDIDKCAMAVKSVLLKQSPGEVYVDSVISPRTAFIWNNEHNFFILGDLDNKEYNEQLSKVIYESIFKRAKQKDNLLDFM